MTGSFGRVVRYPAAESAVEGDGVREGTSGKYQFMQDTLETWVQEEKTGRIKRSLWKEKP